MKLKEKIILIITLVACLLFVVSAMINENKHRKNNKNSNYLIKKHEKIKN